MVRGVIGRGVDRAMEHYIVVCLILGQFALTWSGVGGGSGVGTLGVILCVAGAAQRRAQVDLWVLVPLIGYSLAGMASSSAHQGSPVGSYPSSHMIFAAMYLLSACLKEEERRGLRRLCVLWAGAAGAAGMVRFVYRAAVEGSVRRLGGIVGNPNGMGIFLVLGWFALLGCLADGPDGRWDVLGYIEPVLLAALGRTLSMGSFLSMAAGLLVLLLKGRRPVAERVRHGCRLLARASLGVGSGVLLYVAAGRTGSPRSCLVVAAYVLAMTALWRDVTLFLEARGRAAMSIAALGVLVALGAVAARPGAAATFGERLEMMGSALSYLGVNPLLGVGPYRWRLLDLRDGGTYFNTWHIHNVPLHVGVELGWAAMAMLAAVAVRFYRKGPSAAAQAGFTAFLCHNLMDTSFFYVGITSMLLLTAGSPCKGGREAGRGATGLLFGSFGLVFAYELYCGGLAV